MLRTSAVFCQDTSVTPLKGTPRLMESWGGNPGMGYRDTRQFQWLGHGQSWDLGLPLYFQRNAHLTSFDMHLSSSRAAKHLRQCTISIFFKTCSCGGTFQRQRNAWRALAVGRYGGLKIQAIRKLRPWASASSQGGAPQGIRAYIGFGHEYTCYGLYNIYIYIIYHT